MEVDDEDDEEDDALPSNIDPPGNCCSDDTERVVAMDPPRSLLPIPSPVGLNNWVVTGDVRPIEGNGDDLLPSIAVEIDRPPPAPPKPNPPPGTPSLFDASPRGPRRPLSLYSPPLYSPPLYSPPRVARASRLGVVVLVLSLLLLLK